MASVPDSPLPTVAPGGLSGELVRPGLSPQEAGAAGRRNQQLGGQLQQAGRALSVDVLAVQERANTIKVMEAENKVRERALSLAYDREAGYLNLHGERAVSRPDGLSLTAEYGQRLDQAIQDVELELTNDAQRNAFRQRAMMLSRAFRDQVTAHELREFRTWSSSVAEGSIALRQRELVLDARDPDKVAEHTRAIQAAVYRLGELNGWAANDVERRARTVTSQAHRMVLDHALNNGDLDFADAYRKRYQSDMEADDILAIDGKWTRSYDAQLAMTAADEVFDAMGRPAPPAEALAETVEWLETGHIKDPAARLVARSPVGAMGIMQIMPGTAPEAARLAGVAWDPERFNRDAGYQRLLGRAYLNQQLRTFGSAPAALAAYNAGPAVVQDWIDGTNRSGKNRSGLRLGRPDGDWRAWASRIPFKETRNYVLRGMQRVGQPPAAESLGEAITRLRADPRLAGNPQRLLSAEQRLKANWAIRENDRRDQQQQALNDGIKHLLRTGGDIASIPPAVLDRLAPTDYGRLMDFSTKLVQGRDVTAPADFLELQALLADPEKLRTMRPRDVEAWRLRLSQAHYDELYLRYAVMQGGGIPSNKLGTTLRYDAIKRVVDNRLVGLGLRTTGRKAKEADIAREAAIRRTINEAIGSQQRHLGRQLTDLEIEQAVDSMFRMSAPFHPARFFGGHDPEKIENVNVFGMTVSDLPKRDVADIRAALKARGALDTDDAVLEVYYRQRAIRAGILKPIGRDEE